MAKGPFKLRSGNSPLFKQVGATPVKDMKTGSYAHKFEEDSKDTPAYLKEFGIGKGTSPYKQSYKIKKGDTLSEIAATNNTTVEALMEANPDIKDADKIRAGAELNLSSEKPKTKVDSGPTTPEAKGEPTTGDGTEVKTKGAGLGGVLIGALTGGLDAVYGTGKILPSGSARLIKKKVEKETKPSGEHIVDNLISNPASTSNIKKTKSMEFDDDK